MKYIITRNKQFFQKIGNYNYCDLKDMKLGDKICIDSECTGLTHYNNDMFCVQIGAGKNSYLIDFYTSDNAYTFYDVIPYIKNKVLVLFNAVFDLRFFYKYNFVPGERKILDPMIGSQCLWNGKKRLLYSKHKQNMKMFTHSFGDVFELEMGVIYDKTEQKNINKNKLSNKEAIEYCFQDVDRLLELEENISNKLKAENSYTNYLFQCEFLQVQAYMEFCGLPIDEKALDYKIQTDKVNIKKSEIKITNYILNNLPQFTQPQLNIFESAKLKVKLTSPLQMIEVFKSLGISIIDEKTGKESIAEDVINKSDHEFVPMWLDYKGALHSYNNFGKNLKENLVNKRLYSNFRTIGETGRLQSRAGGINFLNFPSDEIMRQCIASGPESKIVAADYASQEKVCSADISQDEALIDIITNNKDPHCKFARVLFPEIQDLSDEEIKEKHPEKRQYAKQPSFGLDYGSGAFGIANTLNIELEKAQEIERNYKQLYSGIYSQGEKKLRESLEKGYIELPYGFKYHFSDFDEYKTLEEKTKDIDWTAYRAGKLEYKAIEKAKEEEKEYQIKDALALKYYKEWKGTVGKQWRIRGQYFRYCLNYPSQSTSSFQTKLAMIKLFRYIVDNKHFNKALIINSIYDEICMEVINELVHEYEIKLAEIMINSANEFLTSGLVKMKCDAYGGLNWYEAKKAKNYFHEKLI